MPSANWSKLPFSFTLLWLFIFFVHSQSPAQSNGKQLLHYSCSTGKSASSWEAAVYFSRHIHVKALHRGSDLKKENGTFARRAQSTINRFLFSWMLRLGHEPAFPQLTFLHFKYRLHSGTFMRFYSLQLPWMTIKQGHAG